MAEYMADKGFAAGNAMVGMVIGGRAAKACDVCGKERAGWYCAADLAYLCERCDGNVHSANALAGRHERVRLGPNGAPIKIGRTPMKSEAAAAEPPPAHRNPGKRPRSIRRHKLRSLHASKHGCISSINHMNSSIQAYNNYNTSSILAASTHNVMINNPRNDPEFFTNYSNDCINYKVFMKAENFSPADIGDQVKVPDHSTDDDDPLFESLFDFRELQDADDLFQEVPIYNPLHNQDSLQYIDQCADEEEIKPIIITTPYANCRKFGLSNNSSCAVDHPSEDAQGPSVEKADRIADRSSIDSDNDLCDLDQLDFDSVLHGHDEDAAAGDEIDHASMDAFHVHVIKSHNYTDVSHCLHTTRDDSGYAEDSYAHHGNGMDDTSIDDQYEGDQAAAGYGESLDFDGTGSESPRTWLRKVKVESPPQLGISMQGNNNDPADVLLREKLTCRSLCPDSQNGLKLGLKLNFEDVLSAWSDRGTFWMDGQPPDQLSSCLDFLGGWLVPEMVSTGEGQQLVPVLLCKDMKGDGDARKASVLRYREKRHTRLFAKKIRYEVRKLNAEKRPRMKGRFVKRISIVV